MAYGASGAGAGQPDTHLLPTSFTSAGSTGANCPVTLPPLGPPTPPPSNGLHPSHNPHSRGLPTTSTITTGPYRSGPHASASASGPQGDTAPLTHLPTHPHLRHGSSNSRDALPGNRSHPSLAPADRQASSTTSASAASGPASARARSTSEPRQLPPPLRQPSSRAHNPTPSTSGSQSHRQNQTQQLKHAGSIHMPRSTSFASAAASGPCSASPVPAPPSEDSPDAAPQTTHAVQQAALRNAVQADIARLLNGTKAYTHRVHGAPALSSESLSRLARPRVAGAHPDVAMGVTIGLDDPLAWAQWKTDQLAIARLAAERRAAEEEAERKGREAKAAEFRDRKAQAKAAKEAEKARQAAEEAAYGRAMGSFLNTKGREEVEEFRRRKEEERERVAYARSRLDAKGFSAHRY